MHQSFTSSSVKNGDGWRMAVKNIRMVQFHNQKGLELVISHLQVIPTKAGC